MFVFCRRSDAVSVLQFEVLDPLFGVTVIHSFNQWSSSSPSVLGRALHLGARLLPLGSRCFGEHARLHVVANGRRSRHRPRGRCFPWSTPSVFTSNVVIAYMRQLLPLYHFHSPKVDRGVHHCCAYLLLQRWALRLHVTNFAAVETRALRRVPS